SVRTPTRRPRPSASSPCPCSSPGGGGPGPARRATGCASRRTSCPPTPRPRRRCGWARRWRPATTRCCSCWATARPPTPRGPRGPWTSAPRATTAPSPTPWPPGIPTCSRGSTQAWTTRCSSAAASRGRCSRARCPGRRRHAWSTRRRPSASRTTWRSGAP
ncbi:MAG: hypothetical protein AVDCRST_MAG54-2506, partial [uncultured Actinomycetospora sp.]